MNTEGGYRECKERNKMYFHDSIHKLLLVQLFGNKKNQNIRNEFWAVRKNVSILPKFALVNVFCSLSNEETEHCGYICGKKSVDGIGSHRYRNQYHGVCKFRKSYSY